MNMPQQASHFLPLLAFPRLGVAGSEAEYKAALQDVRRLLQELPFRYCRPRALIESAAVF